MAYTLKLTNGRILLNLSDQKTDALTTSLTLIGKNVPSYGTFFNENLIYLLENFASPNQPRSPLVGQLWYDSAKGRMFVYNQTNQFKPVGGPVVSATPPASPVTGDLWLDSQNKQLSFYDGSTFLLAGLPYANLKREDGTSNKAGWIAETILDNAQVPRIIQALYNNGVLIAVVSEVAFTANTPYNGISAFTVGMTLNNSISGLKILGTSTNASSIVSPGGLAFDTNAFLKVTGGTVTGTVYISTVSGIAIGPQQNLEMYVDKFTSPEDVYIQSSKRDAKLKVAVTGVDEGLTTAMTFDPNGKKIGLWTDSPEANFDVAGNVKIRGNLTVVGTGTNVELRELEVDAINIKLAYPQGALPDAGIDGGGIILYGTTPHTILYRPSFGGWEFNDNVSVFPSKGYYVGGQKQLDSSAVYVASAPNLTSVGLLTTLNVGNLIISTSTINVSDGTSDLVLGKSGIGNISAGGKKIINLAPNAPSDSTTTAVTKYYVDNIQALKNSVNFVFSLDVTGITDINLYVIAFLGKMLPISNPLDFYHIPEQARCRVNCMNFAIPSWTVTGNNNYAVETVDKNNVPNAVSVLTGVTVQVTSPVTQPVSSTEIRQYFVVGGAWVFDQVIF
jgi:hypothetical protein